ncbi:hypothetical protein EU95_1316 [Prochlorococcus marinus str. MIT 9201]|uniref:Uncharacterized protein n=1 Tax=Prochlorococcus marinus str. MIT 9201 TaxID=93057 RepID=A0A0A2A5E1_PROMR|nr:hypothetical protein EU95_1316 [Prochlorococcus marinus str. MIT 9201]
MTEERLKSLTKTYPKYYIHVYIDIYGWTNRKRQIIPSSS